MTPDLVVTDIRMPPANFTEGLDAARIIRAELPHTAVVRARGSRRRRARNGTAGRRAQHRVSAQEPGNRRRGLSSRRCSASTKGASVMDPALVQELVSARRRDDPLEVLAHANMRCWR